MKYFLYFSTDLEKLVEGFCLFFLNKNQKKQFLEPTLKKNILKTSELLCEVSRFRSHKHAYAEQSLDSKKPRKICLVLLSNRIFTRVL